MTNKNYIILLLLTCLLMIGCTRTASVKAPPPPRLMTINLVDRNGLMETISIPDRIKQFQTVDFLNSPQPYQKVLRVFSRDSQGNISAIATSYHANGQIRQYLDIVNNRAMGKYREWHPNGCLKIEANVIGGTADINPGAERSWLFDGLSYVWNEQGQLEAEIPYARGELEGTSVYYHSSGKVWKKENYHANKLDGDLEILYDSGATLQKTSHIGGIKCGSSYRYWEDGSVSADEQYVDGLLMEAQYFNLCGEKVSEIHEGEGWRALFGKEALIELQEFVKGKQDGEVRVFGKQGRLVRMYHMKDGAKNGEETLYYDQGPKENPLPKLLVTWSGGIIQGPVKTWFDNGRIESQREMSENVKNGMLTAWYRDGSLMLIEEYDHDKLIKGEYYRINEKLPVSYVNNSKGVATIFDANGAFVRKITYHQGKPID